MITIELKKKDDRSLVAVLNDDMTVEEYLTCTAYDGSKPYGSQWCWGHYYGDNLGGAFDNLIGPNMDEVCQAVAEHIYFHGTKKTMYGNYIFSKRELEEGFCVTLSDNDIEEVHWNLLQHPGVLGVDVYDEDGDTMLDVNFGTAYCGIEEG